MTEKEIGIGKLMGYVEEMQKEGINICRPQVQEYYILRMILISKHYGLIQWLVENDKINFYKGKFLEYPIGSNNYDECDYLDLIQWLAISDTPIDDLIYYLK